MKTTLHIQTEARDQMVEVTHRIQEWIRSINFQDGIIIVNSLHTTAGITVNENADPDVKTDMLMRLDEVYPWNHPKDRHMEGNTASHLKASTVGHSQTIIVSNGQLLLGTWQGVYFCEFDGPRQRKCVLKAISTI